MRRVAVMLVIAACHSRSNPPPPPPVVTSTAAPDAAPRAVPRPAKAPMTIDPAIAAEFAELMGVDAKSLVPLAVNDGSKAKFPAVVAKVPADRAQDLARTERDHFAAQGYLIFRSAQHFGFRGAPDEIALIAAVDQFDILRAMETDGANYDIDNQAVIARLQQWDAKYGLVIYGAEVDTVEAAWVKQPDDMNAFAAEVYKWCPDVVDQGTNTVAELAKEYRDDNLLYLWWD